MNDGYRRFPRLVQRMSSKSRNNQVRLGERYDNDYMGATEFEAGLMGQAVRAMHGQTDIGEFMIDGRRIYAAWNSSNFNAAGVEFVLTELYMDRIRTHEPTYFNGQRFVKQLTDSKLPKKNRVGSYFDAWFDIENGLFWTWEKINIKDIPLNIAKSVAYMDQSHEERRERNIVAPLGRATLQTKLVGVKEQLSSQKNGHDR